MNVSRLRPASAEERKRDRKGKREEGSREKERERAMAAVVANNLCFAIDGNGSDHQQPRRELCLSI